MQGWKKLELRLDSVVREQNQHDRFDVNTTTNRHIEATKLWK